MRKRLLIRNQDDSSTWKINMADTCEESSSEGSDSILSANFSIYSESSTSDEDERNEEANASRSSLRKRKSRTEKSSSPSKQAAKKTKRSANVLNDDQVMGSWCGLVTPLQGRRLGNSSTCLSHPSPLQNFLFRVSG